MRKAARRAIYRAMAADPSPRPAFEDWTRARDAGIDIAPSPAVLRPWRPALANVDDWRDPPKLAPAGADALVMDCDLDPPEAQALWRAADRNGIAPRLFEADRRLEGYAWYDAIDRVTGIVTELVLDGKSSAIDDAPLPERTGPTAAELPPRPEAVRIALAIRAADGPAPALGLPTDLAFAGEAWSWLDDALPLVTADSALQPHELAALLRDGFFSPSDDADADSYETQLARFDEDALHLATRLLLSDDEACRTSIAEVGWVWKDAYEAAEAAVVIFMQRYGRGMRRNAGDGGPRRMLAMLEALAALEPSHTRRSEEQVRLQQFSTPLPLAYAALQAAAIRPGDVVLEPSAGTGMLAVMAQCALGNSTAGNLHLNEYAQTRARLLTRLFPEAVVTAFNAETIADRLRDVRPTVVLMNPPFSATPGVDRITRDADLRHVRSAASMLPPGGRLVTITSAHCAPGDTVGRLDPPARCVFTMAIDGRAYARRGTGFDTRLTVLERGAGPDVELDGTARAANAAELLDAVIARMPTRQPIAPVPAGPTRDLFGKPVAPEPEKRRGPKSASTPETRRSHNWGPVTELVVETGPVEPVATDAETSANDAGPYAPWRPRAVRVPGAVEHPRDRGRSRRRPVGRRAAGLDRRGADGTPHRRGPRVRVGRSQHRPHAQGRDPVVSGARLPGAVAGALHRRRRQSPQPAGPGS